MDKLFDAFNRILKISENEYNDEYGPDQIAGWDSLTHLELVSELEDLYDIEFDIDQISAMRTIGNIKNILVANGIDLTNSIS